MVFRLDENNHVTSQVDHLLPPPLSRLPSMAVEWQRFATNLRKTSTGRFIRALTLTNTHIHRQRERERREKEKQTDTHNSTVKQCERVIVNVHRAHVKERHRQDNNDDDDGKVGGFNSRNRSRPFCRKESRGATRGVLLRAAPHPVTRWSHEAAPAAAGQDRTTGPGHALK